MTVIVGVDDLPEPLVCTLLDRAKEFRLGAPPRLETPAVVGLVFFDTSLRTRVGFAAAAARLGACTVDVLEARGNAVAMPESWEHTLRTMAGYTDVVVARVNHSWVERPVPASVRIPVLNAGDTGPNAEHPSQALIDRFALQTLLGPVGELTVAVVGDLRMRAARSLLRMLARTPPRRLLLITVPGLDDGVDLPAGLRDVAARMSLDDLYDVDALYVVGMPHGAIDEAGRTQLRVAQRHLAGLTATGVVFCPLPVIDEMEPDVVTDPRMQAFTQSDLGLFVRMALLEELLGRGRRSDYRIS